jgi:hypothetical protein
VAGAANAALKSMALDKRDTYNLKTSAFNQIYQFVVLSYELSALAGD